MKGFKDIWRYLQGDQHGKAANRLEREALSDPFLYEALEGFEEVPADHEQVVGELERRLQFEPGGKRPLRIVRWLAAASVLLVGGVAVWLLTGREERTVEQMAVVMQEIKADSAVLGITVAAAVAPALDTVTEKKGMNEDTGDVAADQLKKNRVGVYAMKEKMVDATSDTEIKKKDEETVAGQGRKDSVLMESIEDMLQGQFEDLEISSVASGKKQNIRIRGISAQQQQPPRSKVNEQRENGVISYDTGRKRNRKAKSVVSLATDLNRKAEGNLTWQQRFERYVADSLRYPETARMNRVEGDVLLSVRLNKKGYVSRIRVSQGLTPDCDREAVRLVEAFRGAMGNGKTGNIELTIPFRLKEKR